MSNTNSNTSQAISGTKVRRMYFVGLMHLLFWGFTLMAICFAIIGYQPAGNEDASLIADYLGLLAALLLPLGFLSMLNKRYFGKYICTINKEGIYFQSKMIPWADIQSATYHFTFGELCLMEVFPDTRSLNITGKGFEANLRHAPKHLVKTIKKRNPAVICQTKVSLWNELKPDFYCGGDEAPITRIDEE